MVSPAVSGRDTAINVSVQCKNASKCLPLAELEGKMPLAADEVLLYPRRRRYIVSEAHQR